jgi:hypothetical protein
MTTPDTNAAPPRQIRAHRTTDTCLACLHPWRGLRCAVKDYTAAQCTCPSSFEEKP